MYFVVQNLSYRDIVFFSEGVVSFLLLRLDGGMSQVTPVACAALWALLYNSQKVSTVSWNIP